MPETRDRAPFDRDNRACVLPFSCGPRDCLGKGLARAVVGLVMARLLFGFDVEMVGQTGEGEDGRVGRRGLICRVVPVGRGGG